MRDFDRRSFLKIAGMGSTMIGLSSGVPAEDFAHSLKKMNPLPRWRCK